MAEMLEIRWHGRGGQGAKTASQLLGEAAAGTGRYVQSFPEYGPERMGAPVTAFNRISDEPITLHCNIAHPRVVLVLDASFTGKVDFTDGMPEDGILIINTDKPPAAMRRELGLPPGKIHLYTVDASEIARQTIGRDIPNTPMMGAFAGVTGIIPLEDLVEDTRKKLEKKFRSKPEVIEGNLEAIARAAREVRGE
ncbi:MAG: 2-oxoacid:acceptor oxidoreductase family protein [Betaproteobacteria bacterium]